MRTTNTKVGQDPELSETIIKESEVVKMEKTQRDSPGGISREEDGMLEETRETELTSIAVGSSAHGGYSAVPEKEKDISHRASVGYDELSWDILVNINKAQDAAGNKEYLDSNLGGIDGLVTKLGTPLERGLSMEQVRKSRENFGENVFPEAPMVSFLELFIGKIFLISSLFAMKICQIFCVLE